jgi:hypothetical protein
LTNNTADSDWQQSEEKSNSTRSVDGSVSDTSFSTYQNGLTSVLMRNIIPDQNQITYRILLVKIMTFKNKLNKMVMSVKNNPQRIAQKKTVNMKTVCVKVFH